MSARKLTPALAKAIRAKRAVGWSQARIATWLAKAKGVRVTQQQISNVLAAARDEHPRATKAKAAGTSSPMERLAGLQRTARRIRKFGNAPLQLRALDLEARLVEREIRLLEATDAAAPQTLADLVATLDRDAESLRSSDPQAWLTREVPGTVAPMLSHVEDALSRIDGSDLEIATVRNARAALTAKFARKAAA